MKSLCRRRASFWSTESSPVGLVTSDSGRTLLSACFTPCALALTARPGGGRVGGTGSNGLGRGRWGGTVPETERGGRCPEALRTGSRRCVGTETRLTGEEGEAGRSRGGAWPGRGRAWPGVAGGGPVQSARSLAAQKQWAGRGAGSCPGGKGSSEGRGPGRAHPRRCRAGDSAAGGAPESGEAAGDAGRSPKSPPGRGKSRAGGRRGGALGSGSSL